MDQNNGSRATADNSSMQRLQTASSKLTQIKKDTEKTQELKMEAMKAAALKAAAANAAQRGTVKEDIKRTQQASKASVPVQPDRARPVVQPAAKAQTTAPANGKPAGKAPISTQAGMQPRAQAEVKPAGKAPVPTQTGMQAPAQPAAQGQSAAGIRTQTPAQQAASPAPKTAARPKAQTSVMQKNIASFGLEPVLPYSIEEAVNRLRINISFLGSDVKKIMLVSSEPNEGKSFIALNLWKQMAVAGEPSILVDLDMRKSVMAKKYAIKREDGQELKGTSHFLSGDDPIENVILGTKYPYGDILPNVDNIVNPSMLLESRKFAEMMQYMEQHYRYVFVDVPPLGLVSDGELIGSVCDGAVLCVRGGVTSRHIIRRSIRQLERAGCPVLGIILNRVGGSGSTYYHKYYGKRYYYNDHYYYKD